VRFYQAKNAIVEFNVMTKSPVEREAITAPSTWLLFRIWASIGLQSFGGGASTTFLIQRAFIERYRWITMEDFQRLWNLCLLTPGINLIALTILLGKKLGGTWGIVASLAGMLVPSATITCLLAAIFLQIEHVAAVQAVLRGVVPATGGIMLLVGLNFALPLIRNGSKEGVRSLLAYGVLTLACVLAIIVLKLSVIIVVLGAVLLGILFFSPRRAAIEQAEAEQIEPVGRGTEP
jgi:chromate transporter